MTDNNPTTDTAVQNTDTEVQTIDTAPTTDIAVQTTDTEVQTANTAQTTNIAVRNADTAVQTTGAVAVPSKERFNFWRFIRLCSLKDINKLQDDQSQAFTELNSRLTALEEKLGNNASEVQKSVDELRQDFSVKQEEVIQKIGEQINGLKIELKADSAQLHTIVSNITEAIAADFTSIVDKIVSQISAELNKQITASQDTLSSSIEDVAGVQQSIEKQLNDIDATNKNAQHQVLSACTSVEDCHQQLKQQTKTHIEIENMCAELMQTVRMLVLNTLSGQIELLLPENTSSQSQPSIPKKKR